MKDNITLFFALACFALNAQTPIDSPQPKVMTVTKTNPKPLGFSLPGEVLIDQQKRQPSLIIKSKVDTVGTDYITESGIFRGSVVKKTYTVEYAANEQHDGLSFDQIIEVLNDKKEPVKKVLAVRETMSISNGTIWYKSNMKFNAVPNNN